MKNPFATTHGLFIKNSPRVKFNVDEKNEIRKMKMLRNRLNGRMFRLNQQMGNIFVDNIGLQNKIDEIHMKGSGNYGQHVHKPTSTVQDKSKSLNYSFKK